MRFHQYPLQIGVTGGIGSGKSVVCRLFSCLGVPVYDADSRAKWITSNDIEIKKRVIGLIGAQAYTVEGVYNRTFVAARVFTNPELLQNLNGIIHPAVQEDTARWVEKHSRFPYIVKEAAIMNKAGQGNSLDYVIVVSAPVDLRIGRVLQRDSRTEDEIRTIIARQVSQEERQTIADFTIENDLASALIPQVMALHEKFLRLVSNPS